MTNEPIRAGDEPAEGTHDVEVAAEAVTDEVASVAGLPGGDGAAIEPDAETELWAGRTHWKHYMGRLVLWAAANIVVAVGIWWLASAVEWLDTGGAVWLIIGVMLVSGAVVIGRVALIILSRRYRLTSQRLFIHRGLLSQTVDQTELIRVDDVRVHMSLFDRACGLGTVAILSTDATDREICIEGIRDVEQVAEAIRSHMRSMRRKSLFVENL